MTLKKCESCGMPMMKKSDFGGGKENNRYCTHCTYPDGGLKPQHEIRGGMILYFMKTKKMDRAKAAQFVDEHMAGMPAWK